MEHETQRENSYVFDPNSPVEMARLIDLHRVTTKAMGGPLVGVPELPEEAKVLDLACGPGGWCSMSPSHAPIGRWQASISAGS